MKYYNLLEAVGSFIHQSAEDLEDLLAFVEQESDEIDSASMMIDDIDSPKYKQLEKDSRALAAIGHVIHNNIAAFKKPDLLKNNIFLYDYEQDSGQVGAVHIQLNGDVAEGKWIGSYGIRGSELLKAGLKIAKAKGATKVKLTAKWDSEGFYRKMGLRQAGVTRNDPFADSNFTDFEGDLEESTAGPIHYMSYGMLTNPLNMPDGEFIGPAVVKNFKFEMLSYANIVSSPGDQVHGVLWAIDKKTLSRLDRIEGYPRMYDRRIVPVWDTAGNKYAAEIYLMTPETRDYLQDERPDRDYVRSILDGYKHAGVPLGQVRQAVNDLYNRHRGITEANMSPSALKDFAKSDVSKNFIMGFEAEILIPDLESSNNDDFEPDYSQDMPVPTGMGWQKDVRYWLKGGDNPNHDREIEKAMEKIDQQLLDYIESELQSYLETFDGRRTLIELIAKARGIALNSEEIESIENDIAEQNDWYHHAVDTIRDDWYQQTDYMPEFLKSNGIKTMKDFVYEYNLDWPYYDTTNNGTVTFRDVAEDFRNFTGYNVIASPEYHGVPRKPGQWIVEPDTSLEDDTGLGAGAEIISPPMPFRTAMTALNKFWKWADRNDAWTNESCGFHVGISIVGQSNLAIDPIKLVLFLGDEHVLGNFGRQFNRYSQSSMKELQKSIRYETPKVIDSVMDTIKTKVDKIATDAILQGMLDRSNRYLSISIKDKYVEFRSAGGNYLDKKKLIVSTILRYVRTMAIAADPAAERQDYLKKLYKLVNENKSGQKLDSLEIFTKFISGDITRETLKHELKRKHGLDNY